jgi:arylsulfatase A-like enzyme
MGIAPLPVMHGHSLRPYLEGRRMDQRREHIFSEYLENEEAYIRTREWKYVLCSGKRERKDGYETDNPTPGPYRRLYDLKRDPGEFHDVAARHPDVASKLEALMLDRFRATHAEGAKAIEFYLTPPDA